MITVVIPTLNKRRDYLKAAVDSVAKQTTQPYEIIIINNGLGEINTSNFTVPVKCFNTVYKAGVAQARNIGVTLASTNYIAFLDDDDLWASDYIELMVDRIKSKNPDCLIARLDQINDKNIIAPFKNADGHLNKNNIYIKNPGITGSSIVVSKNAFIQVGGFDSKLSTSEDKALILEFLIRNFKVITVPECQAILRQHQLKDRLTGNKNMANGIYLFYQKYKSEMNNYQKVFNKLKINRYLWLSQKSFKSGLKYGIFYFLLKFYK